MWFYFLQNPPKSPESFILINLAFLETSDQTHPFYCLYRQVRKKICNFESGEEVQVRDWIPGISVHQEQGGKK